MSCFNCLMSSTSNRERVMKLNRPKKVKSRKKWNRPTMKMLIAELYQTSKHRKKEIIKRKIETVRAYCKLNPETVTYYPDKHYERVQNQSSKIENR